MCLFHCRLVGDAFDSGSLSCGDVCTEIIVRAEKAAIGAILIGELRLDGTVVDTGVPHELPDILFDFLVGVPGGDDGMACRHRRLFV